MSGQTRRGQKRERTRKDSNAMAFVGKANCVQANLRFTQDDQQVENTLYFEYKAGTVTTALMSTLGDDLITWWTSEVGTYLTDKLTFREVYLTDLTTQTSPTVTVTTGLPATADLGQAALPNNASACISFRTSGRGRSSRGRNYLAGVSEDSVSNNTLNATFVSNLIAAYESLMDAATYTDDWTWIVYSRFENGNPRAEALIAPVDAVVFTDRTIDSQRRRLPGRGR
jgi:hypothetical protein